jgi:hydrogenase maturation protease
MASAATRVLFYGFGNPGRLDDGLGPAFARVLERESPPGVLVDADYQLAVEDAAACAQSDVVVFVDADLNGPEPFSFYPIEPDRRLGFTSHAVRPEAVLAFARDVLGGEMRGYMLGIRGYEFDEFGERLSEGARDNLEKALVFARRMIERGSYVEEARSPMSESVAKGAPTGSNNEVVR